MYTRGAMTMHLFGLTGGIASGKSTVAARLRAFGVAVIDADEVAREVVASGTEGLRAIVAEFGDGVLDAVGTLDRKALGRVVFADDAKRKRLNAITHPLIGKRTLERAAELERAGESLACYEAALLVENGAADAFRPLVVVSCPEEVQIARILVRGATRQEALDRIRAQKPVAEKVAVADFVIDTDGPVEASARRTREVLAAVCARVGVDPARYGVG
jgi:dephospho-CoA kinase